MSHRFADIAFTPNVQRMQERHGSRAQYARMQERSGPNDALGPDEADFLARADSFYLADGQRNRLALRAASRRPGRLRQGALADAARLRRLSRQLQYVSAGNALGDDRVAIIVMDYAHRRRLKLLGHLRFVAWRTPIRSWSGRWSFPATAPASSAWR